MKTTCDLFLEFFGRFSGAGQQLKRSSHTHAKRPRRGVAQNRTANWNLKGDSFIDFRAQHWSHNRKPSREIDFSSFRRSPVLLRVAFASSYFLFRQFWCPFKGSWRKVAGVAKMRRNIFFMWQMASFYVRVMSTTKWGGVVEVVE